MSRTLYGLTIIIRNIRIAASDFLSMVQKESLLISRMSRSAEITLRHIRQSTMSSW